MIVDEFENNAKIGWHRSYQVDGSVFCHTFNYAWWLLHFRYILSEKLLCIGQNTNFCVGIAPKK
jgi:hypothetical protein